jgi:hypothetical protein
VEPDAVGSAAVWKIRLMVRLVPPSVKQRIRSGSGRTLPAAANILPFLIPRKFRKFRKFDRMSYDRGVRDPIE